MEKEKFFCQYCGKEFNTIQARTGHYASCKIKLKNINFICQFCEQSCTNLCGLTLHEKSCKLNPNRCQKMRPASYPKIICDKCNQEFNKCNFEKHYESCTKIVKNTTYHLDHTDLFCKWCGKEFPNKNSLVQHECRCKSNPNAIIVKYYYHPRIYGSYECQFCNREFTTLQGCSTHETFCQLNPDCKQHITGEYYCQYCGRPANTKHGNTWHEKNCNLNLQKIKKCYHTTPEKEEARRQKISNALKNNLNAGGLREGSGRGKSGWYKGIHCDSTWE